jgi:hypothetical protein
MATMFSGGTFARMLCTCWNTKPPAFDMMVADGPRAAQREDLAGVAAAAPEHDVPAEIPLQALGLHAAAGDLNGVDGIQARLDQIGQQLAHPAAAVEHDLDRGE